MAKELLAAALLLTWAVGAPAQTLMGFPISPGIPVPDLGNGFDFNEPSSTANQRCLDAARRNLAALGLRYKGTLEVAAPDTTLICKARNVQTMPRVSSATDSIFAVPAFRDPFPVEPRKATTAVLDPLLWFRFSESTLSDPLAKDIAQLLLVKGSLAGRVMDAQRDLAALAPIVLARRVVLEKLAAIQTQMGKGVAAPPTLKVVAAVWPHKACLSEFKSRGVDEHGAKRLFEKRFDGYVQSDPQANAYAFYKDYLDFVEGFARYKDPHWNPATSEAITSFGLGASCHAKGTDAMLLPFFVELRPAPPSRGRRPLQASDDTMATIAALEELGVELDEEVRMAQSGQQANAKALGMRAAELLPRAEAKLVDARQALQSISTATDSRLAAVRQAERLATELVTAQQTRDEVVAAQGTVRIAIDAARRDATAKAAALDEARHDVDVARNGRDNVTLRCGGTTYEACTSQAARLEYDKALYEASQRYTAALRVLIAADDAWGNAQEQLANAQERPFELEEQLRTARNAVFLLQVSLDNLAQTPALTPAVQAQEVAAARHRVSDWEQLVEMIKRALALSRKPT